MANEITIGKATPEEQRNEFEKLYEPRKYMSAQEAKELNLIDEITEK